MTSVRSVLFDLVYTWSIKVPFVSVTRMGSVTCYRRLWLIDMLPSSSVHCESSSRSVLRSPTRIRSCVGHCLIWFVGASPVLRSILFCLRRDSKDL